VQRESVEIIGDFMQRTSIDSSSLLSAPHGDKDYMSVAKSTESTNPVVQRQSTDYLTGGSKSDVSYDLTSVSSWETQQGNEEAITNPLLGRSGISTSSTNSSIRASSDITCKPTIDYHRLAGESSPALIDNDEPIHQPINSSKSVTKANCFKTSRPYGSYPTSKSYAISASQSHHGNNGSQMSKSLNLTGSSKDLTAAAVQSLRDDINRKTATSFNGTDKGQTIKRDEIFNKTTSFSMRAEERQTIKRDDFFNKISYEHWPFSKETKSTSGDGEGASNPQIMRRNGQDYYVEQLNVLKNSRNSSSSLQTATTAPVITSWLKEDTIAKARLSLEEREMRLKKVQKKV